MKKTYWVKKDPQNGEDWIEMNGKQFYDFITSDAGKNRYFLNFGAFKIEVTEEKYQEVKKEKNRRDYLQQIEDKVEILSLESIIEDISSLRQTQRRISHGPFNRYTGRSYLQY